MIFARHNFVYNFINASGSGDTFTTEQMIVDQLTRLTIEHRAKVIKALRDNGVDVKADATVEKVSKLVLENAAYNDDLSNELTDLIIEYNIPKTEWKIDADGELFKGLFNEGKEYLQGDEFKVDIKFKVDGKSYTFPPKDTSEDRKYFPDTESALATFTNYYRSITRSK